MIAWIYQTYGDLPAVVDKIIMPQILSVSRLKGSAYRAKDFIVGEGREKFQNDLTESLQHALEDKRIIIHNALIRHVNVPEQILSPIQEASIAIEQDLTNKEKQNTARKQAELNTEMGLIEQRREQVAQETEKLRAEIKADQERQVAQTQAETLKQVADIGRQTATIRAEKTRTLGQASAQVVQLVDGEKAKGFELKTKAFRDPQAFALWEFANRLNTDVKINILHAGPGTLWTDLEKARLSDLGGAVQMQKQ
jgi:predicted TIM-barrel fold metal-dependent hydrolase